MSSGFTADGSVISAVPHCGSVNKSLTCDLVNFVLHVRSVVSGKSSGSRMTSFFSTHCLLKHSADSDINARWCSPSNEFLYFFSVFFSEQLKENLLESQKGKTTVWLHRARNITGTRRWFQVGVAGQARPCILFTSSTLA